MLYSFFLFSIIQLNLKKSIFVYSVCTFNLTDLYFWLQDLRPIVRLWDLGLQVKCPLQGQSLSKGSYPLFTRVSEKTTENSERLGRQAQQRFKPGTSRLLILSVTTPPLVGLIIFKTVGPRCILLVGKSSKLYAEQRYKKFKAKKIFKGRQQ